MKMISESSRFENFELSQWSLQLDVKLTGAFLCTKHFGSEMVKDGLGGVVLNISSDLSVISLIKGSIVRMVLRIICNL